MFMRGLSVYGRVRRFVAGRYPGGSAAERNACHSCGAQQVLGFAGGEERGLIYAVNGCGGTCVLSYPDGKLVGELTGVQGLAACSDSKGNVFISEQSDVVEYAHGGTSPIATYNTAYNPPSGCSVDPESGDLAVVNGGYVAVFPAGSKNPTSYDTMLNAQYCGYDNDGNLFVDGFDGQSVGLSELPKGSDGFEMLSFEQNYGDPGQIQWDGKYLSYESQGKGKPTICSSRSRVLQRKLLGRLFEEGPELAEALLDLRRLCRCSIQRKRGTCDANRDLEIS